MENLVLKPPTLIFNCSRPKKRTSSIGDTMLENNIKDKYNQIKELSNCMCHLYNLEKSDISSFKILINYFNNIEDIKDKIYQGFSFNSIIQYMYSKCCKNLNKYEDKSILNYFNESEKPQINSDNIDKIFYHLNKINDNIDFDLLGLNTGYYHKKKDTSNNIKYTINLDNKSDVSSINFYKNLNNHYQNSKSSYMIDTELLQVEDEFENIEL